MSASEQPTSKELSTDELLDELAGLAEHWQRLRAQKFTPQAIRMAMLGVISEIKLAAEPAEPSKARVSDTTLASLIEMCDQNYGVAEKHGASDMSIWENLGEALEELRERRAAHEPAAALCVDPAFEGTRCPFTKLPYFMHLEHPELGRVPTYGGPYDSYTIPVPDDDNERTLRSERYDHDEGAWIEGGEPWPMNLVTNEEFVDLHTLREERAAEPPPWTETYNLLADDAYAATFQSLGQYRATVLGVLRGKLRPTQEPPAGLYTIEPHGDGHTLYRGRDQHHHGFNLARITEATPETLQLIERALNATASQPPAVVQDMEKIAWCQKVHEDLAMYVDDGGGQMIHVRAKRALGIMFDEMQKLEKALYPSLTKPEVQK